MDLGIRGRVAVVTGADGGMGLSTARMLLEEGARVVMTDRTRETIETAAGELKHLGEVEAVAANVTKLADVATLRTAALKRFGKVDILVHAAGINGPTGPFETLDDDAWMEAIEVDLLSAVRVVRAFVTGMRDAGWGRIVLFASEDGEQPYPVELPYCAAKAAVMNLTKGLAKTYSKHGVLINSVSPAFIATPMTDAMMHKRAKEKGTSFEEAIDSFLKEERPNLELRRRGDADEVASAVLFLCSERASFITGTRLRVDGGSVATV